MWLADQGWATLFITLVHVWGVLPLVALVFIAGLQAIPDEVYSASAVDGASPWRQFRHITLPLLRPSLVVALVVGTVNSINIFDEIYVLNGTALNTRSILMEVYTTTFANGEFAEGIALAFMVALATALLAASTVSSCAGGRYEAVAASSRAASDRDRAAGRLVARAGAGWRARPASRRRRRRSRCPPAGFPRIPILEYYSALLGGEGTSSRTSDAASDASEFARALLNTVLLTVV